MKKIKSILSICILNTLFCMSVYSQEWCFPGAKWYYSNDAFLLEGYSKLEYTKDTSINNVACKKITHYYKVYAKIGGFKEGYTPPYFTYAQNGVAYIYNNRYGNNKFDTLFNINAKIGDKWRMPLVDTACADSMYFFKVLNTGKKTINGVNLKWLYIETIIPSGERIDTIVERLGYRFDDLDYSVCHGTASEVPHGNLRCYSDNSFGFYSTGISSSCDLVTGIAHQEVNSRLKIYPNPANEKLNLSVPFELKGTLKFEIYDLTGKLLISHNCSEQLEISTASLKEGVYLCKWYLDDVYVKSDKLCLIH